MPIVSRSKFSKVPDSEDFEDVEPTPITDIKQAFDKISRTSKLAELMVDSVSKQEALISLIPEIKMQIDSTSQKADQARVAANEARDETLIVRTRQEEMGHRLSRIEKNGHICSRGPEIEQLKLEAAEQRRDQVEGIKTRQIVLKNCYCYQKYSFVQKKNLKSYYNFQ
jgi:hypothetical protein